MSVNINLLKNIVDTPGATGHEKRIRNLVLNELEGIADDVSIDNMGNVTALKKGRGDQSVMVAAHMDEIGFVIKHIDDNGFLKFHTLGGFDPKTLTAQRVIVHGKEDLVGVMGTKPIHVMTAEERKQLPKTSDFFIDLGMSKEEVEQYVEIGNPVTRERELIEMGNNVNSKSIDNRISVYVLLETLRELKDQDIPYDFYGVFTVQEEVGLRGAQVAGHTINPNFAFGLDTTIAFDTPGAKPDEEITKLGEGVGIKIMDASAIADYRMIDFMKATAKDNDIKWQPEILTAGGTDTGGIQRMVKEGVIAGAVSIPTRNMHQVIEMANKDDIRASIDLLSSCITSLDKYDWSF